MSIYKIYFIAPAITMLVYASALCPANAQPVQILAPAAQPSVVIAPSAPPPPRTEAIPPPPSEEARVMYWRPGHWAWDGANWTWTTGEYVQRPTPAAVWEPGHWLQQPSGGYVWVDGRWQG